MDIRRLRTFLENRRREIINLQVDGRILKKLTRSDLMDFNFNLNRLNKTVSFMIDFDLVTIVISTGLKLKILYYTIMRAKFDYE